MNNLFVHIFFLLFLLLQGKTTSDIIGRWEGLEKSPEGLHRRLEFNPDGSFTNTVGTSFKGTYKLQGNRLITTYSSQPESVITREMQQFSIKGGTLILKVKKAQIEAIRLTPRVTNNPAIVGRWQLEIRGFHGGAASGLWEFEFSKAGDFTSNIEFYPQKGHYKIEGDLLVTTVDNETETIKFRFDDGILLLKSPDVGSEEKFRRIEKN